MNYQPIEAYLPHAPPMIFLDRLVDIGENHVTCIVDLNKEGVLGPFLTENNELPSWYLLEVMAQTVGVWNGYHTIRKNLVPKLALLLGSRAFYTTIPYIPLGKTITIKAELILQDQNLANFSCLALVDEEEEIGSARINVYHPDQSEIDQLIFEGKNR